MVPINNQLNRSHALDVDDETDVLDRQLLGDVGVGRVAASAAKDAAPGQAEQQGEQQGQAEDFHEWNHRKNVRLMREKNPRSSNVGFVCDSVVVCDQP